jgi:hypothetical protein
MFSLLTASASHLRAQLWRLLSERLMGNAIAGAAFRESGLAAVAARDLQAWAAQRRLGERAANRRLRFARAVNDPKRRRKRAKC